MANIETIAQLFVAGWNAHRRHDDSWRYVFECLDDETYILNAEGFAKTSRQFDRREMVLRELASKIVTAANCDLMIKGVSEFSWLAFDDSCWYFENGDEIEFEPVGFGEPESNWIESRDRYFDYDKDWDLVKTTQIMIIVDR